MFCVNCGTAFDGTLTACASCGNPASQMRAASREVGQKVKNASSDALQAFKVMALNPVGGLPTAFQSLGKKRALSAGIVFGIAFALVLLLAFTFALSKSDMRPNLRGLTGMLILGIVPFLAIAGASALARKLFRGDGGSIEGDVFIAGSSLLPLAFVILASGFLGIGNAEVIGLLGVFAICYSMNMLFVGSTRLSQIPEQFVTPAVAVMLVLTVWLSKIIITSLIGSSASQLITTLF